MNSKLISFYVNEQSPKSNNKSYPSFNSRLLKNIPIAKTNPKNQKPIIEKADLMLQLNNDLQEQTQKFISLIKLLCDLFIKPYHLHGAYLKSRC